MSFASTPELREQLTDWIAATFGAGSLGGADADKWQFVTIDAAVSYWAFVCHPDRYDGLGAATALDEIAWLLDRGEPKPGDRAIVWQAKGSGENRGVVALGEIVW